MTPELQHYAERLLEKLCVAFPLGYRPALEWRRLRVTAGVAYYRDGKIALSSIVLTDQERLRTTLFHEYAHLLAYSRYGRRGTGHGAAWKLAMKELGLEPRVKHAYEVARNRPRQKVIYLCKRCGANLVRSRRLPRRRQYVHANCGGSLKLHTVLKVTAGEGDA